MQTKGIKKERIKGTNLTLLKIVPPIVRPNGTKRKMGLFRCMCGNESIKSVGSVRSTHIKNCSKCGTKQSAETRTKHGLIKHTLYRKWCDMKKRCYNPNVDRYKNYGALGVTVCKEWKNSFTAFYDWSVANGWEEGLTIDRKDVYKSYSPSNCRYITIKEQGFNKKNTFYIEFKGERKSLAKLLHENGKSEYYKRIWWNCNKDPKRIDKFIKMLDLK